MDPDKLIQIIAMLAEAHDFTLSAVTLERDRDEDDKVDVLVFEAQEAQYDA